MPYGREVEGQAGTAMLKGLYKVEFETPRRRNVGVIYANDGKLHGGSGTFAYIGTYQQDGNTIRGVVTTKRHTDDPDHPPVFDFSGVRITFHGVEKNGLASIEGTADEAPGTSFKALLTHLTD
jgi:hypothetical protein